MNLTLVATGLVLEFCDRDAFNELLGYRTDSLLFCELGNPIAGAWVLDVVNWLLSTNC